MPLRAPVKRVVTVSSLTKAERARKYSAATFDVATRDNFDTFNMIRVLAVDVEALERVSDENYTDLLDQMDEAWGTAMEIGRPEINAMIESRIVHRPTTSLRQRLVTLEAERDEWMERADRAEARFPEQNSALVKEVLIFRARIAELEAVVAALRELEYAAELYSADQSGAKDSRCGLVQPITVEEGEELNRALSRSRAVLQRLKGE